MTLSIIPPEEKAKRRTWKWKSIDKDKDAVDKDKDVVDKDKNIDKDDGDIDNIEFSQGFYDELRKVEKEMRDPKVRERYIKELDEKYGPKKKGSYLPIGDKVMRTVDTGDGVITKVSKNMWRAVETFPNFNYDKNVNYDTGIDLSRLRTQLTEPLPIIDKKIDKDKDLEINKEVEIEKDKEEEFDMGAEGYSPYMTREEALRKDLEQVRKDLDTKQETLQRQLNEQKIQDEKKITELGSKCIENGTCIDNVTRQTLDLFKQLQDRIAILERRKFVCRRCGYGIVTEGDDECSVCGRLDVVDWHPEQMVIQ